MHRFNLNQPIPILILGDGPDQPSGLGRIGRDLAYQLSAMPEFRVGYLGRKAFGRAEFPWVQYSFPANDQWGEGVIEKAWDDFSRGAKGVILTAWDASRLTWFAQPDGLPPKLQTFLRSGKFEKWGYFMHDAEGVEVGRLPLTAAEVFAGYNRVLLASEWAYALTKNTVKLPDVDWIPHGIDMSVFKPVDPLYARSAWQLGDGKSLIVGCVMTNQERKHWPTVFEAIARMPEKPKLWIKTDALLGYWNLNALAVEYGLIGDRILHEDRELTDQEMAMRYSACDVTTVVSGGEGFCYPVAESLACGTPVITGNYGAQAELTFDAHLMFPVGTRIDTLHNVRRAFYDPIALSEMLRFYTEPGKLMVPPVTHLDWGRIGKVWQKWFRKGLR